MPSPQAFPTFPRYTPHTRLVATPQSLLAFAEEKSVCSEEVAIFFGPTANPVGVSTEGVLARPFRAELVLATLQRSVVEEAAPMPGAKATASGASGPPPQTVGREFSPAAAAAPAMPPPDHGLSASSAEPPVVAPVRRPMQQQFMTQSSTERRDAGLPAVSVARRPSNISLLDDDATGATGEGVDGAAAAAVTAAGAMLEEDPDSLLLDGAGGVAHAHAKADGVRGGAGDTNHSVAHTARQSVGGNALSHRANASAPGGPFAAAVVRAPPVAPVSLTQMPTVAPEESQEL